MNKLKARFSALDRLSTGGKLGLSFMTLLALTIVLGGASLWALSRVHQAADELAHRWLPGAGHLAAVRAAMLEYRTFEVKHTTAADAGYMAEYEEKMTAALQLVEAGLKAHGALGSDPDEAKVETQYNKHWQAYMDVAKKVVAMDKAGQQVDGKDVSEGAGKSEFDDAVTALDKLSAMGFERGAQAAELSAALYKQSQLGVGSVTLCIVLLGVVLAMALTRNLLRQLGGEPRHATELLKAVAAGDLARPIHLKPGDTTSLMACLKSMQESLAQVVSSVRASSDSVATASAEIAQGNNDLSGRTEQQASALQQTAASMDELGATVTQNADNARQANDMAQRASAVAEQGGQTVNDVVQMMRGINDSSRRIADITGVIDGIAFQTNILALNAAVEAARAGEQGRGFAVVASEVRSLAQRSATAAKEIKSLITSSAEQIQQGSAQVDRAGATMEEVVRAIQRVTEIVNEISLASQEQRTGVGQVGGAITQMDQATQQNAALVEQSAAAAESLRHQAQQLVDAVAVFKLHA
jgi:methyl-accepting chemotaxis protein